MSNLKVLWARSGSLADGNGDGLASPNAGEELSAIAPKARVRQCAVSFVSLVRPGFARNEGCIKQQAEEQHVRDSSTRINGG